NRKRRSVTLIFERLQHPVASVLAIVDRQPSLCIGIERPGVKALQGWVVQREGRATEGPGSAAHELVSYRILARRGDGVVVGLEKRSVILQHQSSIGNQ